MRIIPQNAQNSEVIIEIDYHPKTVITMDGADRATNMVAVGAFVHNGAYYSAPGFITSYTIAREIRTYDPITNRLTRMDHNFESIASQFYSPKAWAFQTYTYDSAGNLSGWIRSNHPNPNQRFTKEGYAVITQNADGTPATVQLVRHTRNATTNTITWALEGSPFPYAPDTVAPTLIVHPQEGSLAYVKVEVSDNSSVAQVEHFIDGVFVNQWRAPTLFIPIPGEDHVAGPHLLTVRAIDFAGNVTERSVTVQGWREDVIVPFVRFANPPASITRATTFRAYAFDSDYKPTVEFLVDGVLKHTDTTFPFDFTWDPRGLSIGNHTLTARAIDGKGLSRSESIVVHVPSFDGPVDSAAPTVQLTHPDTAGPFNDLLVISATASDDIGVTQVQFFVDNTWIGSDDEAPYEFHWDTLSVSNGSHQLKARALDASGRTREHTRSVSIFNLDQTPPVVAILSPNTFDPLVGLAPILVEATDNISISKVDFLIDGNVVHTDTQLPYEYTWDTRTVADGNRRITVRATDSSGISVELDRIVSVVNTESVGYDGSLQTLRCAGLGTVCTSLFYLNGAGQFEYRPPHTIHNSCADGQSNVFHGDKSIDELRLTTTDNAIFAPGKTLVVTATVWASAAFPSERLDIYRTNTAATPAWTHVATLSPTKAGEQTLTAQYVLPSGPMQAVRAVFRTSGAAAPCVTGDFTDHDDLVFAVEDRDVTPPTLSITKPTSGQTLSGFYLLYGTASDDRALQKVEVKIDARPYAAAYGTTKWQYSLDTQGLNNGPHMIRVRAMDATSNMREVSVSVNVSNPGSAVYNSTLRVPMCAAPTGLCSTAGLLDGRGLVINGSEMNQPNTLRNSCADGSGGVYHVDRSIDRIQIRATDPNTLTAGGRAQIEVKAWFSAQFANESLDLFYATNAESPAWTLMKTFKPLGAALNTFQMNIVLPQASMVIFRTRTRHLGNAIPCVVSGVDDVDDLVVGLNAQQTILPVNPTSPPPSQPIAPVRLPRGEPARVSSSMSLKEFYFFPNPVLKGQQPTVHIECTNAEAGEIEITNSAFEVLERVSLDARHRKIVDGKEVFEYRWDASGVTTGVYFCRIRMMRPGEADLVTLKPMTVIR